MGLLNRMETTSLERNRRERRDKLHKHPALLIIQQGNSMLKVRMKARRDTTQLISYLQTVAEVVFALRRSERCTGK